MSLTDIADFANLAISKPSRQRPIPTDGLWTSRSPTFLPLSPIPGQDDVPDATYFPAYKLPRHGLAASANERGDVYIYGGVYGNRMDELYHYSATDNTVTPLRCWGDYPDDRSNHAMAVIGNVIAIHGGDFMRGYKDPDLYLLNLVSRKWSRVVTSGRAPGHLWRHAIAVVDTTFYFFGGYSPDYKDSNDIWAFNLDTLHTVGPRWELVYPSSEERPIARYDNTLVSYRDRLILFGGYASSYLGDTWSFDTKSKTWSELQCTGDIPPSRSEHTATILDDVMYIIGGHNYGSGKTLLQDVFALKIPEKKWFKLKNTDTTPKPRTDHASARIGTKIFTFGGDLGGASEEHQIHILDPKYINNSDLHTPERLKELDIQFQLGVIPIRAVSKDDSLETEKSKRSRIVSRILKYPSSKNSLAHLQTTDAQIMVDFLAHELDSQDILQSNADKRHVLHFLIKLAKSARIFPKSTELSEVECVLTNVANNQGGYGLIYKAVFRKQAVCVKAVHTAGSDTEGDKMLRAQAGELVLLAHVSHPNVIPLYGAYLSNEEVPRICIVSPWMENGDLVAYLRRKIPDDQKILLASDTAAGLSFLHDIDIVHADLKAKNVLVSRSQRAILADFGVSTVLHTSVGTTTAGDFGGSHLWMASELLAALAGGKPPTPTKESDVWGFACICYEMFTGEIPFFGHYSRYPMMLMVAFVNGRKITPLRPNEESEPTKARGERWVPLAERCWNIEPSERPTATDALRFLTELNVQDNRPSMDEELATFKTIKDSRAKVEIDYSRVLSLVQNT